MQNMVTLPMDLPMQPSDLRSRFLRVRAPFLFLRQRPLSLGDSLLSRLDKARVFYDAAVTVGEQVHNAAIDGDHAFGRNGVSHLDFAHHDRKPLVDILDDRAGFGLAFKWPVNDGLDGAQFREGENIAHEAPNFWMRLADRNGVTTLAFPSRRASESPIASLPRRIQVRQELCANVTRHIGKPRELSTKRGKVVDLVERSRINLRSFAAGKAHQTLLMGQIPQESQGVFPCPDARDLLFGRVDSEPERLVNQHSRSIS